MVVPIAFMSAGLYGLTSVNPYNKPFTPTTADFNPRGAGDITSGQTAFPHVYFDSATTPESTANKNARATAAAAMTALGGGQNVVADVTDLAVDPITERKIRSHRRILREESALPLLGLDLPVL